MAVYSFHTLTVSLNIEDTPVGYQPPYGYPIYFTATYNQREAGQPANFAYSNLGKKWTHNWLSYVTDDPAVPSSVSLATGGGGTQRFSGYNRTTQSFAPQAASRSVMRRVTSSPIVYELEYPDGSIDRFAASDGSSTAPRKVFLTQRLDPYGNTVTLAYDGQRRITAITDAIGQVTTFSYDSSDPYLITKVTDPFGRFAILSYTPSGHLVSIQDVLGLQSQFSYTGTSDFIESLTTPYGTTTFTTYEAGTTRRLTATDPLSQTEVLEFNQDQVQPSSLSTDMLPAGMNLFNQYLHGRNSYFWSKKAWTENPGDYAAAYLYHWLHGENISTAASPLESEKPALSARIWYNYPSQGWAGGIGTSERPSKIGRRLTDGSTQLYKYDYNDLGRVEAYTDPLGHQTQYRYAANNQDLLVISVGAGGTLASYTYNAQHLPLTATDAAGQTTTYTYNAQGQVTTVTNPQGETTTYSYFGADTAGRQRKGHLSVLNGPLPGDDDTATFDYDALGRVSQSAIPGGYTLSYEYDVFDRITRVIFPDGTTEEASYDRLHLSSQKDRLGRVSSFLYNSLRQLVSTTDPAGRQVKYEWCRCGDLKSLIDAMGRLTFWKHDVQGRVSYKQYPDGSRETFGYDPSNSRLISVTDAKGQVKSFDYNLDNTVASVSYQNAQKPTPGVSYAYDPIYGRLTSMTDGVGTTSYAYHDFLDLQPPISAYLLNQNIADAISGSDLNIVAVGGPSFSSEVPAAIGAGHSMNFDGATQYLEISDGYNPESYTICAWVRPETIRAQSILLRAHASGPFSGCSHQIRMNSAGKFEHYVWDGSGKTVTGTTTAVVGTWYHVAIVIEKNGQARLFVNGSQEGAPVNVGTIWTGGSKWVLGSNSPGSMTFFDGQIDDIYFWWAALDQPRINDVSLAMPPPKMPGAGRLATIDGPWDNDTIAYTYDELGRMVQRSIGGVSESFAFDAAGRPKDVSNQLGSFAIGYDGVTSRVLSLTHSGGQKTEYSYLPAAQDFRLQRIRHLKPDGTTPLSVFDYTYDAVGRILSWRQQEGTATAQARIWAFGYDQADQVTSAVASQGGAAVQSYGWSYDPAGNRLTQTLDGATATSSYNALNELIHTTATLPDQTYEWDAEDRLLAINQGTARTEFAYDGLGRRVRIVEKQNDSVVSSQSYLWEGLSIREQRDASGGTAQQRYFGGGYVDLSGGNPQSYLQTTDHLGSIRETTDTAGNLVQRVSYDCWGNPSFATGAATSPFAFTGHFRHAGSGLHLAPYRAYAATTGRWISRDPIEEAGGINLYAYVGNIPNLFSDPLGLCPGPDPFPAPTPTPGPNLPTPIPTPQPKPFTPEPTPVPPDPYGPWPRPFDDKVKEWYKENKHEVNLVKDLAIALRKKDPDKIARAIWVSIKYVTRIDDAGE
jgi:RHS repeat-associated protein